MHINNISLLAKMCAGADLECIVQDYNRSMKIFNVNFKIPFPSSNFNWMLYPSCFNTTHDNVFLVHSVKLFAI